MKLKNSIFIKINDSFTFGGDSVLMNKDNLFILDVDDLRTRIIAEAHGSRYSIHLVFTKMYHDIKQIYW